MLALARALVTDPAVLLLDELSMGLAPIVVQRLYEIVAQVAREGISILVWSSSPRPCSASPTARPSW
jgi:branched-chain amino acid transport system ATP-binding protein